MLTKGEPGYQYERMSISDCLPSKNERISLPNNIMPNMAIGVNASATRDRAIAEEAARNGYSLQLPLRQLLL